MYHTLRQLIKDQLRYFKVAVLAGYYRFMDMGEGRAMGIFWEFAKPLVFALAMGVALGIGLRHAGLEGGVLSFLVWLFSGYFVWNFMSDMLSGGKFFNSYRKYFHQQIIPLTLIPVTAMVKKSIVSMLFLCLTMVFAAFSGVGPYITWVQVPLLYIIMFLYFYFFLLLVSSAGTLSKDFAMLVQVLSQPLFWTSGVIFDFTGVDNAVFSVYIAINPFAFFVSAFREAVHGNAWFFLDTGLLLPFIGVFVVTAILGVTIYHRLRLEIRNEIK